MMRVLPTTGQPRLPDAAVPQRDYEWEAYQRRWPNGVEPSTPKMLLHALWEAPRLDFSAHDERYADVRLSVQKELRRRDCPEISKNAVVLQALGFPDHASLQRHRTFDLHVPAGVEKRVEPIKLLQLANGYITGRLSKARFMAAVKLLQKPVNDRRPEDLRALGVPAHPMNFLMRDDWYMVGMLNGVMETRDFDSLAREMLLLRDPAFWERRFPGHVDHQGNRALPDILPEDWAYVGDYGQPFPSGGEFIPSLAGPRTSLQWIRNFPIPNDKHLYVACVVSHRLQAAPQGPFGGYWNEHEAEEAFYDLFWQGQRPAERVERFSCAIV